MENIIKISVVISYLLYYVTCHTHHLHNPHKEREADGAYSPRDHGHYKDGEHDSEFDHESILGKFKKIFPKKLLVFKMFKIFLKILNVS